MDIRDQILKAAVKVFAELGSRGATTRLIAEAAGVNEVTLFRHFKGKDELIATALGQLAEMVAAGSLPVDPVDPVAELTAWARDHHKQLYKYRSLIRKTMGEFEEHPVMCRHSMKASTRIAEDLVRYLTTLQTRGLASRGWDPHAAASLILGALFGDALGRDAMPARFPYATREAADHYLPLFFAAIGLSRN